MDWVFREVAGTDYEITTEEPDLQSVTKLISYGIPLDGVLSIPDCGLLWESTIIQREISMGQWNGIPTLFPADDATLPFDILSAVFFLLSRYEEYLPFTPDKHQRFPAEASILFQKGVLQRPVVDEWLASFFSLLENRFGIQLRRQVFQYRASYDIDIAYSFRYKGWIRSVGAIGRALVTGNIRQLTERAKVFLTGAADPFDCFEWLRNVHHEYNLHPLYFILPALRSTEFDKNNHPEHPCMKRLIGELDEEGAVALHPSYFSSEGDLLLKEKQTLEALIQHPVVHSRQHYLRFRLPETYNALLAAGITDDWSMGYGTHLGFRAGTGRSFIWYNLREEKVTSLRIHPFCFMDTTAHFEMKLSVVEAMELLKKMGQSLHQCGSVMVTVFHNFSLGTDDQWSGWRDGYAAFLRRVTEYSV